MSDLVYFLLNIIMLVVSIWIVNKFLNTFFEKKKLNLFAFTAWLVYAAVQLFVEYHRGNASIYTTIVSITLVLIIAIANYQKAGKIKLFIIILLYVTWALIEMLVFFFMHKISMDKADSDIIGAVVSRITMIIVLCFFSEYWGKKNSEIIPAKYYFMLLFIPVGSIYIAVNEFYTGRCSQSLITSMLVFSILLLFNILIFEIYSKLTEIFALEKEKIVYAQQLDIMDKSTQEQKKVMEEFHEEKHNLINQLIVLKDSIENSSTETAVENLNKIIRGCDVNENICNSGNSIIDTLINFKYAMAKDKGIHFCLNAFIPETLPIHQCDLGIILGNAIDNAVEATRACGLQDKSIQISMGIKKGAFVIVIQNPYEHILKKDKMGNLLSTKKECSRHGYGVNSIRKVVERYHGEVLTETNDRLFILTVILNLGEF